MAAKYRALFIFVLLVCVLEQASGAVDVDDLKRRLQQRTGTSRPGSAVKLPENLSGIVGEITPQSRIIETGPTELSEADQRYVAVHMKLANRHFSRKDYEKANNEIDLVFTRDPSHSGARFMRAVISARLKKYDIAWYNVLVAKEKGDANQKIKDFIEKLKTVAKEPVSPVWVKGIYRSVPISACEKITDIIESLLKTPVSQNITEISFGDYISSTKVGIPIQFVFSNLSETNSFTGDFKKAINNVANVNLTQEKFEEKSLSYNFEISDLPLTNTKAVPVKDLQEFIKGINEEIDVAISDYEEYEPANGVMRVNYKISVRNFSVLNDFLRVISPYAEKFVFKSVKLSSVVGSTSIIWKTELSVYYLVN
jgi:hypothetical protein